jgi:hypothetical protein
MAREMARTRSVEAEGERTRQREGYQRVNAPSTSGSANSTRPGGSTSGTPPTRVDTTKRPAQAASRIPIPNASVSEGLRKICARERSCDEELKSAQRFGRERPNSSPRGRSHVERRRGARHDPGEGSDACLASDRARQSWDRRHLSDERTDTSQLGARSCGGSSSPMRIRTSGCRAQTFGSAAMRRSIPLR